MKNFAVRMMFYVAGTLAIIGVWGKFTHLQEPAPTLQELLIKADTNIIVLNSPSNYFSGGTGFLIKAKSGKAYVVTNKHVCSIAEDDYMMGQIEYSKTWTKLKVLERSATADLCILEPIKGIPYELAPAGATKHESVYTIGHPKLMQNTYTYGNVRDLDFIATLHAEDITDMAQCVKPRYELRTINFWGFEFQVCVEFIHSAYSTAIIFPGSSGSPVFNSHNQVVGVMFAANNDDNYGLYVPYERLKELLDRY